MSFDISGLLTPYLQMHGKDFVQKAVAGAKTAKLLIDNRAVILGKPGEHQIPILDTDANIQDGSVSGRNASGAGKVSQAKLKIARFKDQQNLNMDDLYGSYLVELMAKGQTPETDKLDVAVIGSLIERRANKIAARFETILWQSDTANAALNADLKVIDGILKQLASGTYPVSTTETTISGKLNDIYTQLPDEIASDPSFRVFMGQGTFKKYAKEIFDGKYFQTIDTAHLAAFPDVKIEVVQGLNGTNKAVFGKITDLRFGVDNESDMTNCKMTWSIETEQWYLDFNFSGGVKVVFPDQFAIATV